MLAENGKERGPSRRTQMPLISALSRQRQEELCRTLASLIYIPFLGQSGLHSETLSQKGREKEKKEGREEGREGRIEEGKKSAGEFAQQLRVLDL